MAWARAYALLATVVAVTFAAAILLGPYRAVERSDYMTYHVAARIVLDGNGACLYDAQCQAEAERQLIGEEPSFAHGALPFNSPPWLAAVVAPLGLLSLPAGFAVFSFLGLIVLACGSWLAAAHAGLERRTGRVLAVVLVLTSWPTALAVIRGQSTLLVVGLLGMSVGLARYRSGLAMGLGLLKPTLPTLWGAWQLLGGHWRAVGTALLVGAGLILLSAVVVSPQALVDYPGHVLGVAGSDALGVHPAEMINWRGVAARLDQGWWLIVAGSLGTLALLGLVWIRTGSRPLAAGAAFLATPLVLPHANQHEFVLAALGILLVVAAVPELRGRLAALAVVLHAVVWGGVALEPRAAAWLLFGVEVAWLLVAAWISGARTQRPGAVPLPTASGQ
jgi:alpha-1,2-mannosyltransferase